MHACVLRFSSFISLTSRLKWLGSLAREKKEKSGKKKKKKKSSSGIKSTSTSLRSSSSSLDHLFIIEPSSYYAQLYYIEPLRIYVVATIIATMMRVSVNYQPPLLFRAITVSLHISVKEEKNPVLFSFWFWFCYFILTLNAVCVCARGDALSSLV